jgi:hypothetical protein
MATMANRRLFVSSLSAALLVSTASMTSTGCMLAANLMHAAGMDLIPAEYEGFEEASVAVVVLTETARPGDDPVARELTRRVSQELLKHVKKIEISREDKVADWWDRNGWDSTEFQALGREVAADRVLVIEVANLTLKDGPTMYRGVSDLHLQVFEVESGNKVYQRTIGEFAYPKMAGQHSNETTEKKFRTIYLTVLAAEIGRSFRRYDQNETVALDSKIAGL